MSALSVCSCDVALTQLPILMLSIGDMEKNASVVPSHGVKGDSKPCGQCQDSCVILSALQLTMTITRAPLLFYLEVQGTSFNRGFFCGPVEGAKLCWNSYLKQCRETSRENLEKYGHANKLFLHQKLVLSEIIF